MLQSILYHLGWNYVAFVYSNWSYSKSLFVFLFVHSTNKYHRVTDCQATDQYHAPEHSVQLALFKAVSIRLTSNAASLTWFFKKINMCIYVALVIKTRLVFQSNNSLITVAAPFSMSKIDWFSIREQKRNVRHCCKITRRKNYAIYCDVDKASSLAHNRVPPL